MTDNPYPFTTSTISWDITQFLKKRNKLEMNINNKIFTKTKYQKQSQINKKCFPKISKTFGNVETSCLVYDNTVLINEIFWKLENLGSLPILLFCDLLTY